MSDPLRRTLESQGCRFTTWGEWRTRLYGCWCILRGKPVIYRATLYKSGIVGQDGGLIAYVNFKDTLIPRATFTNLWFEGGDVPLWPREPR